MLERSSSLCRSAAAVAFALSVLGSTAANGQVTASPAKPTVYNNPQVPDDPRVGLKGGYMDAGVAASGMTLVLNVPKPPGFAPGTTPQELAPPPAAVPGAPPRPVRAAFGSTNSDLAFSGNHVFVGNYNGFNVYDISNPDKAKLVTSVMCPGAQDDITVYGHLLFLSVEATSARVDCGAQGIALPPGYVPPPPRVRPTAPAAGAAPGLAAAGAPGAGAPGGPGGGGGGRPARAAEPASADRFRGVRIFDISDLAHPKQLPGVQTCRGSHTHTLVTDPKDKDNIYLYVSGYSAIRPPEELAGCSAGGVEDINTALYTIVVIQVPLAHPELAKVVNSPRIFSDPNTGAMNGIMVPGRTEGAPPSAVSGCHDITAYPAIGLAAGACTRVGILLDIRDPAHPKRVGAVSDPNLSFWHSAMFNNDGTKVIFDDEWGGGSQPRCRKDDPMVYGADAIFSLSKDHVLTMGSYYKMPAPQTEFENCTAHNGSIIPIPGRDIEVKAWYQGGVSVMDFTDFKHPFEIAYFDRGPLDSSKFIDGGLWSAYWYNGFVYGAEIARGLDVYKLTPSKFITQNEIDAASQIHQAEFNPQGQEKIVFPANFVTAKAYVDQLARSSALTPDKASAMIAAMDKKNAKQLKGYAADLDKGAGTAAPEDASRMKMLAEILKKG